MTSKLIKTFNIIGHKQIKTMMKHCHSEMDNIKGKIYYGGDGET